MIFDDVSQALPEMRAHAESLMRDTVRIERSGEPATNPDGFVVQASDVVYEGIGKWQRPSGWQRSQAGESDTAAGALELHLPFEASFGVQIGDIITCLESLDPALVGRRFGVAAEFTKTIATSRRLRVEVVGR